VQQLSTEEFGRQTRFPRHCYNDNTVAYCTTFQFNPWKRRAAKCYTLSSISNVHFKFPTFGHSGARPRAPECPNVRN